MHVGDLRGGVEQGGLDGVKAGECISRQEYVGYCAAMVCWVQIVRVVRLVWCLFAAGRWESGYGCSVRDPLCRTLSGGWTRYIVLGSLGTASFGVLRPRVLLHVPARLDRASAPVKAVGLSCRGAAPWGLRPEIWVNW